MADWVFVRETSQFALGGLSICVAGAVLARQVITERPKLKGTASRALILSEDLKAALFVVAKIRVTNHSRIANSIGRYELELNGSAISPANFGTTADGKQWFLRSRDESTTAYFPMSSPPNIPLDPINIAPGHTVDFDMAFAVPPVKFKEVLGVPMMVSIGATAGRSLVVDIEPISEALVQRHRADGVHPLELYGPDGNRVTVGEIAAWDDFEVTPR